MQTTPMMGMRMFIYRPFHARSDVPGRLLSQASGDSKRF